jgi:hypothetical protein
MKRSQKIEFQFACDQSWDDMPWHEAERYCERCKHQVLDLTQASWEQIEAASLQGSCGMLRAEQIEPDLIPITMPASVQATLFSLATCVGISTQVSAQSSQPPMEQVEKVPPLQTAPRDTGVITTAVKQDLSVDGGNECKPKGKRSRWYLSRSFPFVKRRVVRTMGRFRH